MLSFLMSRLKCLNIKLPFSLFLSRVKIKVIKQRFSKEKVQINMQWFFLSWLHLSGFVYYCFSVHQIDLVRKLLHLLIWVFYFEFLETFTTGSRTILFSLSPRNFKIAAFESKIPSLNISNSIYESLIIFHVTQYKSSYRLKMWVGGVGSNKIVYNNGSHANNQSFWWGEKSM